MAQSPASLTSRQQRFAWLANAVDTLNNRDVDLLLLPELFLCGYNIGSKVREWGEENDGPYARKIASLAKQHGLAIHYGYAERDGDSLFNSAICFGRDGSRLGRWRKLLLPPGYEGDHFGSGNRCPMFNLAGFNIATLICYDAEFPENFRHVADVGAHLVLVPTALASQWSIVARSVIPTRAFENGVFVCYANHCGHENGIDYLGESCIIAPDGEELARAGASETILHAELVLQNIAEARKKLPYLIDRHRLP